MKTVTIYIIIFIYTFFIPFEVNSAPLDSTDTNSSSIEIYDFIESATETDSGNYQIIQVPKGPLGAVHISTDIETSEIFFDGEKVGTGSVMLDEVPIGKHTIVVEGEGEEEEETVYVVESHVRKIFIQLKRNVFFSSTYSFSQSWVDKSRAFGPSFDCGIQIKKHYVGLNFHWNFFDEKNSNNYIYSSSYFENGETIRAEMFGGAVLQYYYDVVNISNIFSLSPGFCAGFWEFKIERFRTPNSTSIFVGGLSLRTSFGFQYVFLNFGNSLLIGNNTCHIFTIGIRVNL